MPGIPIEARSPGGFERLLGREAYGRFRSEVAEAGERIGDRTIWNVNSAASGGGVAEMLASLLAYARGIGADARWLVIEGDDPFFAVTKRIHNHLHGDAGDGAELGEKERQTYEAALASEAERLGDIL